MAKLDVQLINDLNNMPAVATIVVDVSPKMEHVGSLIHIVGMMINVSKLEHPANYVPKMMCLRKSLHAASMDLELVCPQELET